MLDTIAQLIRTLVEEKCNEDECFGDPGDLTGACGYAAYALWVSLPGSILVLGEWNNLVHCWVVYEDFIVDVTATQFDEEYPTVFICQLDSKEALNYHGPCFNDFSAKAKIIDWYYGNWIEELEAKLCKLGLSLRDDLFEAA